MASRSDDIPPVFALFRWIQGGNRRGAMHRVNCVNFALLAAFLSLPGSPAFARDSLGMYSNWGTFRDPGVPRCYAIAMATPSTRQHDYQPYAAVGTWPKRRVRNQFHLRLSREMASGSQIVLRIGGERFELTGGGGDAWAVDRKMNAAIIAAMRSASRMTVYARDKSGRRFSNRWQLAGAASAMDAASIGCARLYN